VTALTTIVVADDHPAMLEAVAEILERHGFTVVGRAPDGEQAVALISEQKPDLALLDYRMPRLNGIEVAARAATGSPDQCGIKKNEPTRPEPIGVGVLWV
jgi:CheY-like chemotaxis protein